MHISASPRHPPSAARPAGRAELGGGGYAAAPAAGGPPPVRQAGRLSQPPWQRRTNDWREVTSPVRVRKLQRRGDGSAKQFLWPPVAGGQRCLISCVKPGGIRPCPMEILAGP